MPTPRRFDLERAHPAIDMTRLELRQIYNHSCMAAPVICPECSAERWYPLGTLRQQMRTRGDAFTGRCRPCGFRFAKISRAVTKRKKGGTKRIVNNGYVALSPFYVSAEESPMFNAMRNKASYVFEHRWVMAKHLRRPLRTTECIDHMDGNKTNNHISNLRIYVKGKDHAGSGPGHGTYYHEWQMAEIAILVLRDQLALQHAILAA